MNQLKGYGFLYFAKKIGKSLSNKYGQKFLASAKKSTADAIKTVLKWEIQKTAEATGYLIGNKIDKHIKKKPVKELPNNDEREEDVKKLLIKKDIYHPKKDSKLLMN